MLLSRSLPAARRLPAAVALGRRRLATPAARPQPLKLAIIGAGPSGLYAASRILAQLPADDDKSQVHVYERLPAPHGLVRYGVAPDHPEVKNVQRKFDLLANDSRFGFFGNVVIGASSPAEGSAAAPTTSSGGNSSSELAGSAYSYPAAIRLPLESLLPHYSHILLSYGSSLSAPLPHTPGASSAPAPLVNVFPALAFVSWYNGHPAFAHLAPDLSQIKHVTVIGQGNVALDVARILLKDVDALSTTDLPEHVLAVLRASAVETVEVVGRRGPAQVAFTTKEFREMLALPGVRFEGPSATDLDEALAEVARIGGSEERMRKRLLGLMAKGSTPTSSDSTIRPRKTFKLSFLRSPKAFLHSPDAEADIVGSARPPVKRIQWALNALLPPPTHAPSSPADPPNTPTPSNPVSTAIPTGAEVTTTTDLVIESVGYRSEALQTKGGKGQVWAEGWFDDRKGRVRNVGGRVISADGEVVPNVYASGWLARGPIGVIAQTMYDSYSVADLLMSDRQAAPHTLAHSVAEGVPAEVAQAAKEGRLVDWDRWKAVEEAEREEGEKRGKRAEKFVEAERMLEVASRVSHLDSPQSA